MHFLAVQAQAGGSQLHLESLLRRGTARTAGPLGYLGMIFGVGPAWLMILIAGLVGGAFPLAIAMFNLRARTATGFAAIGGFAMGIGYLAGTLGPLLGGWIYPATCSHRLLDFGHHNVRQ